MTSTHHLQRWECHKVPAQKKETGARYLPERLNNLVADAMAGHVGIRHRGYGHDASIVGGHTSMGLNECTR